MALQMQVHKEISAYEPKPMFGLAWRQLGALVVMIVFGGGLFAGIVWGLLEQGATTDAATNAGFAVMFIIVIPAAMWGWWRPLGLKPEQYLGYALRHRRIGKDIGYDDTHRRPEPRQSLPFPGRRRGPRRVQEHTPPQRRTRGTQRTTQS